MPSSRPCEPLTFTVHPPNTKLFTFKVALQFGPGPKQKAKSMSYEILYYGSRWSQAFGVCHGSTAMHAILKQTKNLKLRFEYNN